MKHWNIPIRTLCVSLCIAAGALPGFAGVSRAIQDQYKKEYENKALFLRIPVYGEKQMINITGNSYRVVPGTGTPRFKVGDQLRVLSFDFGGDEVRVRLGAIGAAGVAELGFKFDTSLEDSFPNRDVFDRALRATLTEGLRYTDLEDAKRDFVQDQFERSVRDMAGSASISREAVLRNIASQIPAYQEAQRDIENLKSRVQELSGQLSQSQSANRKLEAEGRALQAEIIKLKNANASLQDKLESYNTELAKLGDEVRNARGSAEGYQREIANLQRTLNLRVDSARDLAAQITELGQALKKLQKENEGLGTQINTLRTDLSAQQAVNARLVGENQELKAEARKQQSTIAALTSKEDSLARRYLDLKNEKEKLDDFAQSIRSLRTRVVAEEIRGGVLHGKANVYVQGVLLGSLDWSVPANLQHNESGNAEAVFTAESIDYVRVTPEQRHVLHTLGEKLRLKLDLESGAESVAVTPAAGDPVKPVGERERASWQWTLQNNGTKDTRILMTARLVDQNSNEIPVFQHEQTLAASNVVRQVRGYLQPIPLAAGVVLGFLLFGIVGIFRRPKHRVREAEAAAPVSPEVHIKKKL